MGQYTEGQRLQGSDGNVYVVQNGMPVRAGGGLVSPKAPYEAPQAAATLQRTQQEIQQAQATAAANTAKTKAEADSAQSNAALLRQKVDEAAAQKTIETMGPNSQVHGEEYLKRFVPPSQWATVRAYARGDLGSRAGGMSSSMLPIIQHAMNYDPTTSGANFPARVKMQSQLANGDPNSIGGGLRSMEQMLLHGSDVLEKAQGLNNFHSGITAPLNYPRNMVKGMESDPTLSAFQQAVRNYAPESQKAIAGSAGGEGERADRQGGYSPNMSPEAVAAGLQADAKMAFQRMGAINDQYRRIMGRDITDALSPQAKVAYDTIMAGGYDEHGKPLHPAAGWVPISGTTGGDMSPPAGGGAPGGNSPLTPPTVPGSTPPLAGGGASVKSLPIPREMQAAHDAYVHRNWGHLDPDAYASFRAGLDKQYGFATDSVADRAFATAANNAAKRGDNRVAPIPPVNAKTNATDRFNATVFNNHAGAALLGAGSLMGGMDEVAAGIRAPFTGRSYEEELDRANAMRQASEQAYPGSTMAGNVAGTIGLGIASGGASFMADSPILAGAGYGAVNGALENNDNRLAGAVGGAVTGATGGALGKYALAPVAKGVMDTRAGQAVSRGGRKLYNGLFGNPIGAPVADAPLVPSFQPGERTLLGGNDLADARANMQQASDLGLPYSLADASPKTRMLAGSVARKSPDARSLAEQTFDPRAMGQADRAVQAIDTHLAPVTNIEQRGSDLLKAGDQAAGPSYNLALARPGPVDPQIDAMLKTPAGQTALQKARTIAANEGRDPNALGFDLDQQGNVVFKSVPSFESLQLVKRGLDSTLEDMRDPVSGQLNLRGNPLAQSVNDLRGRFVSRLGELNPDYAAGNDIWKGYAQRRDALNLGYKELPNNGTPFRQFEAGVSNLTPETLPEAQMGYATNMADTANKARFSANPYDSIYGSPLQQQKVGAMFPEGAPTFGRQYALEGDMAKTRTETLGGSPTAARTAADQMFDSPAGMALDAGAIVASHGAASPAVAAKLGTRAIGNVKDTWLLGLGKKRADALAPILFNTDTQGSLSFLDELALRKAQDDARRQAFRRGSGLFGSIALPAATSSPAGGY